MPTQPTRIDATEAARLLGIDVNAIIRQADAGAVPRYRVDEGRLTWDRQEVRGFVEERELDQLARGPATYGQAIRCRRAAPGV